MKTDPDNGSILKHPSAYLPIAMSLAALGLVLGHAAVYGIVHEADEGAAAHIFQILMVAQVPIVAIFVIKWLPRRPREIAAGTRNPGWRMDCRLRRCLLAHLGSSWLGDVSSL